MNFSDAFLNIAYQAVAYSQCESEDEKQSLAVICKVCNKYGLPFKTFVDAVTEVNQLLEELTDGD